MIEPSCTHAKVRVDYDHPFGLVPDVPLTKLQALDPAKTRPMMTLSRPRCADCGVMLTPRMLGARTLPGGDLYDPRFLWPECSADSAPHAGPLGRSRQSGS